MRTLSTLTLLFLAVSAVGCYHAEIVTGKAPSNTVVEKEWFLGFVNGLVIPEELDVAEDCPAGVAKVETKISFLNQLVSGLTGGIFSPMTVRVTCAANESFDRAEVLRSEDAGKGFEEAANRSLAEQAPVYVAFSQ